jgi:uncharacterized cupredoxin-like copper-binding protein
MKYLAAALFVLTLPAEAAPPWAHPQVVTVVMVDDAFQPDHVTFHAGQPTELILENHGKDAHEFSAPDFFKAASLRDRKVLTNGGKEVYLPAGKTAQVWLVPPKPGTYQLTCPDHDWDGMVGTITVE